MGTLSIITSLTFMSFGNMKSYAKDMLSEQYTPITYVNSQEYGSILGAVEKYDEKRELYDTVVDTWDEVLKVVEEKKKRSE